MDHRTTSQEASPNGHQKPERAAPSHTPTPWKMFRGEVFAADGDVIGSVFRTEAWADGDPVLSEDQANAALIVKAVNTYASNKAELLAAYERIAKLEADLHECREYIEQEVDVVDGDYGQPAPNRAMQLVTMIDESLNGPGAF